jgi:hypothetical protein
MCLACAGKFFFDRQAVRTNYPLAGTDSSRQEREQLWNNVAVYTAFVYEQ